MASLSITSRHKGICHLPMAATLWSLAWLKQTTKENMELLARKSRKHQFHAFHRLPHLSNPLCSLTFVVIHFRFTEAESLLIPSKASVNKTWGSQTSAECLDPNRSIWLEMDTTCPRAPVSGQNRWKANHLPRTEASRRPEGCCFERRAMKEISIVCVSACLGWMGETQWVLRMLICNIHASQDHGGYWISELPHLIGTRFEATKSSAIPIFRQR